jgi:hypothetical protein
MANVRVQELPQEELDALGLVVKLFLHGLGYSILVYLLGMASGLMAFFFAGIGSVVGFLIAIGLLLMILGWSNGGLALSLWGVKCDDSWLILMVHGIMLLLTFIIAGVPAFIMQVMVIPYTGLMPFLAFTVATVSVYAVIYGYLGRRIAVYFMAESSDS